MERLPGVVERGVAGVVMETRISHSMAAVFSAVRKRPHTDGGERSRSQTWVAGGKDLAGV